MRALMKMKKRGGIDVARIYQTVSIAAFSMAGISLSLAAALWFRFKIWRIIGDLSGRTAKKSIARMRRERENSVSFRMIQRIVWIHTDEVIE